MIEPVSSAELHAVGKGEFSLSGELTFATVPNLWRKGGRLFTDTNKMIILDLGEVIHSDSAGLALMMEWLRQSESQNIIIQFQNIPKQMLSLARTSGIDFLLEAPEQRERKR
uniref:Phospholipid transport system transporter-binding protein n=1 Tax=Candidatus Kentrum sp. TUN TaxID=2126343 RepID=A0A450ZQ89_9GAMM|nr:MAG: phospholipid transport system transporter-binding protein [Candidatus Kentron sp. TUN]VFK58225.1 MAG: phospholipid transport system transporter-binding protein [Candidatus Kentron sp. TUN]VFK62149.1 MAG: phospholipid transport system transporter-binding protein [Candidatus Kentron sp. TUN]